MPFYERDGETSPEARFEAFRNYSGELIVAGSVVALDVSPGADGVRVVKFTTGAVVVGIAHADAIDGALFAVQTKGWRRAGALILNDTAVNITGGDILIPVSGQWYLVRSGAPDQKAGFIFAGEGYSASNPAIQALKKVYIKT